MGLSEDREHLDDLGLDPTRRRLLRAFVRAVVLAEPIQRDLASQYGLSLGDFRAVRVLSRLGPSPVSRFGSHLGVPRSTITNLADRLEHAGMIERMPDPTDRRVTLVRLTPAGQSAVEAIALLRDSEVARRLETLEPQDALRLAELLERVVEAPDESIEASAPVLSLPAAGSIAK